MTARYCGHCNMRFSRCLCNNEPKDRKTNVPNPLEADAQSKLPVDEHPRSRVRAWTKWLETEGVRLGWTVKPEQHQSSQDRCQKRLAEYDETSQS